MYPNFWLVKYIYFRTRGRTVKSGIIKGFELKYFDGSCPFQCVSQSFQNTILTLSLSLSLVVCSFYCLTAKSPSVGWVCCPFSVEWALVSRGQRECFFFLMHQRAMWNVVRQLSLKLCLSNTKSLSHLTFQSLKIQVLIKNSIVLLLPKLLAVW